LQPVLCVLNCSGKHIFEQVIGPHGILRNKTRILVTHGIGYLSQTDLIIVLSNGTVSEVGTYRKLLQNRGAFSDFLRTYLTEDPDILEEVGDVDPTILALREKILQEMGTSVASQTSPRQAIQQNMVDGRSASFTSTASMQKVKNVLRQESRRKSRSDEEEIKMSQIGLSATKPSAKGKLVEVEKIETGGVKWTVYLMLANQMSYMACIGIAIFYGLSYGSSVGANFWLSAWANDTNVPELARSTKQRDYRLGIYALFGFLQGMVF